MVRTKVCRPVSAEALQFDGPTATVEDNWSYGKFGEKWETHELREQ